MSMKEQLLKGLDPVEFVERDLGLKPFSWQKKFLRSPRKKAILNCSRQAGKSTITACLALWRSLFWPRSRILILAPCQRQSELLLEKIEDLVLNLPSGAIGLKATKESLEFPNGSKIIALPSDDNKVRGFSAVDMIIIDEAARVSYHLYHAVCPMLAVSDGWLILLSTPKGKRGFFYEEWVSDDDTWERVMVPATECPKIPSAFLEYQRENRPEHVFNQEYMCVFSHSDDQYFTDDEIADAISDTCLPLFETSM